MVIEFGSSSESGSGWVLRSIFSSGSGPDLILGWVNTLGCVLYTSPSPLDRTNSLIPHSVSFVTFKIISLK